MQETAKGSTDGGTGGDPKAKSGRATARSNTQVLKPLRIQPKINVMQRAGWCRQRTMGVDRPRSYSCTSART